MSAKYRVGQQVSLKNGDVVVVTGVVRSIHGNVSLISLKYAASGESWARPVRTSWLTQATEIKGVSREEERKRG